jgi:hypothetical protein
MALTVEDGSGVDGANSYLAVADADTYHLDRGNTDWAAATTAAKQTALIRATDYIEQEYGERWKGCQVASDQALAWPRYDVPNGATGYYLPSDELPQALLNATAILALEALAADLNPNLDRGGMVKRERVDVLETEYMDSAPPWTSRPAVDGLLQKYLTGSSINRQTVRV